MAFLAHLLNARIRPQIITWTRLYHKMSFQNLPSVPGAEPERCVLDAFRLAIAQKLHQVFPNVTVEQAYDGVDYSKKDSDFTVAIPRFKMGGKPTDWTEKFKNEWTPDQWVDSLTVNGPFLLFKCKTDTLTKEVLGQIDRLTRSTASGKPEYGSNDSGNGKKVVIGRKFFNILLEQPFFACINPTFQPHSPFSVHPHPSRLHYTDHFFRI